MIQPKIFISYSWSSPEHQEWVMSFAERLVSDEVDVVIDKWSLKEGQDKFNFMETMVKSNEIHKVLIILDKKYFEKAEQREGGVGTETQIISPKIYGNVSQEKFIPIISETDENGKAYVPTFLEGRIYIDLSDDDKFEENYETLLRNLFQRPAYNKPKLGKAPSYLFSENPMTHKTSFIIRSFESQITKSPSRINSLIREFLENYFEDLKGYTVTFSNAQNLIEVGKNIHDTIQLYTPLRNDYILFLDKVLKSELMFDIDIVIKFLEKLPLLKYPQDNRSSWSSHEFDNFKFFIHETFLYTIAVGLKNESYKFVEDIIYSGYFFQEKYNYKNDAHRFDGLYNYVGVFDTYYKETYSQNFFSPMADIIIKRLPDNISKNELTNADLFCHYISALDNLRWFPITYVYKDDSRFELFDRLISQRHFEKIKGLFNITTAKELQEKLKAYEKTDVDPERIRYSNSHNSVKPVYRLINIETIGTIR